MVTTSSLWGKSIRLSQRTEVCAGNPDIIVGEIRRRLSVAESVPVRDVQLYLVAGHAIIPQGTRTGIPFFFKAMVKGRDVTANYDAQSLLSDTLYRATPPDGYSWLSEPYIAASAVRNIKAIINNTNELAHSPGPNGLPGGYPIRINASGVEVVLPTELTLEEAKRINLGGLRYDGIEEIRSDGTVVLTDEAYKTTKDLYGLGTREFRFGDMEDIAKKLVAAVKKLAKKYG